MLKMDFGGMHLPEKNIYTKELLPFLSVNDKDLPFLAFTEQGVAMLSTVLNRKRAIQVTIAIMRAFVKMKNFMAANNEFSEKLKTIEAHLAEHDDQFQVV